MRLPLFLLVAVYICTAALTCTAAEPPALTPGAQAIHFTESAEQSNALEVKLRLHSLEDPGAFDITKEEFQLVVPKSYKPSEAWGLFIWISASDSPRVPADWEAVLAARKLLFIGAAQSGNKRNIFDRVRMAIDASVGMRKRCRIDEQRVYVSGMSGGARVASMVGVCFADLFSGAIPFMGVNFYTELPAGGGKTFGVTYIPDDEVLAIAKKRRFVLVTSEKDFNRVETHTAELEGFKKEGFANVLCLEVPGIGHAMPPGEWLEKGLGFLDGDKVPK